MNWFLKADLQITILIITFAYSNFTFRNSMDIVSRIKKFLESQRIAISQFADTCNIPRPTISQILNGRNKKISDELISKIHVGFPELSMLWLMFGEGNMLSNANNQISERQDEHLQSFETVKNAEHEMFGKEKIDFSISTENKSDNFGNIFDSPNDNTENNSPLQNESQKNTRDKEETQIENIARRIAENNTTYKKITNIVVFYDDSTFQTFSPSN